MATNLSSESNIEINNIEDKINKMNYQEADAAKQTRFHEDLLDSEDLKYIRVSDMVCST
jgi:hypothetical protein